MNIMRMKGRAKMMRTIKVTGKGKIAVKPDMIRLYVNKEDLCQEYEETKELRRNQPPLFLEEINRYHRRTQISTLQIEV